MNIDNVSEVSSSSTSSTISSTLCNGCENIKDGYNENTCSLFIYHQIATARNELISVQRSLIRELLKDSKEFQEKFGNDSYINDQGIGAECNIMQADTESIREEICFVKSIKDFVKGSNEKEKEDNVEFENVISVMDENNEEDDDTGSFYSSNSSQNNQSSSVNEPLIMGRIGVTSGSNHDNMQTTTFIPKNHEYLGCYEGFNSIYLGIGKITTIDIRQLKKCLEKNFGGNVRYIRIIRDKGCAFAEFQEKSNFRSALRSGCVTLNGINIKINKTYRKKNFENPANERQPRAIY